MRKALHEGRPLNVRIRDVSAYAQADFFAAFLTFAQRAFWAAAILACVQDSRHV
jgi:hypothetical protein